MTLNQALKKYPDAKQIKIAHDIGASTKGIEDFVIDELGDIKILNVKLGKTQSIVIFSAEAFEEEYFKKENERCAQKSAEYFARAVRLAESKIMPKEREKDLSIETLDPAIKVGAKVLELSGGCIAEIVEIDEYEGIKVKILNRGEIHNSFFVYKLEERIEAGTHTIINNNQ